MRGIKNILHSKSLYSFLVFFSGVLACITLFGSGYASADCGFSGTVHDYAGLQVVTMVQPYGGGAPYAASGGNDVQISDYGYQEPTGPGGSLQFTAGSKTAAGNVVQLSPAGGYPSDDVTNRVTSATFSQIGDCGGSKAVLPGNGTNGSTSTNDGGSNWGLDCDNSKLGNDSHGNALFEQFSVTGVGTPSGATPGGTWNVVDTAPEDGEPTAAAANGTSNAIVITYTEPGPSWTLEGGTSISPSTVAPGQSVQFTHYVSNTGPDPATYYWHVQGSFGGGSYSDIGGTGNSGTATDVANGATSPITSNTQVPWPNDTGARDGSTYCQRIVYTNATGPSTSSGTSPPLCTTLQKPTSPVVTCNSTFIPEADSDQQGNNINIPPGTPSDNTATNPDSWSNPQPPKATDTETTAALVTITGTSASPASFWQGETLDPTTDHSPYTANYVPSNPTISVTVNYYENALTHLGGNEWVVIGTNNYSLSCLNPTTNNSAGSCSLSVSGGDGPGGVFTVGQTINVSGAIYNAGGEPSDVQLPVSNANGNLNINFNGGEYDWGSPIPLGGSSGQYSLGAITANGGPNPSYQTITASPAYGGAVFPGGCSITFPVYAPFSLTPNGSTTLAPDPEDPSSVDNDTYVTEGGAPVNENVTSNIYEVNAGGATIPKGNTSNGGPFSPGTTTCLYESPSPYNVGACNPTLSNGAYAPSTPLFAADTYCSVINVPATTVGGNVSYVGPAGDIVGGAPASTTSCPEVVNKPFFKVYGNGAEAGGSFPSEPAPPGGGILASWDNWNNNNGLYPSYDYGGGSELANIASSNIVGYAGAQQSSQDLRPAPDLNFANTAPSNVGNGTYTPATGGQYGSLTGSLPSEGCDQTSATPTPWPGSMPSTAPGNYSFTASGETSLGAITIYPGQNVCLNVTGSSALNPGNVYISGNITYKNANSTGVWSPSTVPSFVLNANGGNIYISPNVGELDGTYVAEPNGGGGTIYTCGNGDYTAMSEDLLFTGCNQQLSVYGAFEAQSVNLMRTYGTLRDETPIRTSDTEVTGYDQPDRLAQFSCDTPNPADPYKEAHWYEAVDSSGNPAPGAVAPPLAADTLADSCPNPTLEGYDGYVYPPGDTNFTSNHLNGNYDLICEDINNISSGGDDHYILEFPYNGASACTGMGNWVVVGYGSVANVPGTTEPFYEYYDSSCHAPASGHHYYTIHDAGFPFDSTSPGEPPNPCDGQEEFDGAIGNVFTTPPSNSANSLDSFAETIQVPVLGPSPGPSLHECSNNGGWTSSRPTCAAEVFDYSPEASLGFPVTTGASTSANSAVGIYSLPPVL